MAKANKVEVQKGPIEVPLTRQNMLWTEKQKEAKQEVNMLRDGQSPKLKMPKNGK